MPNTWVTPHATIVSTITSETVRPCGGLGRHLDVDAVVAHLDREARGRVGEPGGRRAGERVVVVAVPRAAQPALLDRTLAERPALVRAAVVERAVAAVAVGEGEAAVPGATVVTRPSGRSSRPSTRCQAGPPFVLTPAPALIPQAPR